MTFEEMQADYVVRRKGGLGLPITGILNYSVAAILSLWTPVAYHNLLLTICFWGIMPVGALISRLRGEQVFANPDNPLFKLSALGRTIALLTWSIHIPVWIYAPALFPLTVGIGFCLHWLIFSWSMGHSIGFIRAPLRIGLVLLAWHLADENKMGAVAAAVVIAYAVSVWQLSRIDWKSRGLTLKQSPQES